MFICTFLGSILLTDTLDTRQESRNREQINKSAIELGRRIRR